MEWYTRPKIGEKKYKKGTVSQVFPLGMNLESDTPESYDAS